MEYLRSKTLARKAGHKFYQPKNKCVNGHSSLRWTSNGRCIACESDPVEREKMRQRNQAYYKKHKERLIKASCDYQRSNRDSRNKYHLEWQNKKKEIDPVFAMTAVCRRMLHRALGVAGQKKYKSTFTHLGYTSDDLVQHLESQFKDSMSWENYGEWHIDHIIPLSLMIKQGYDVKEVNALSNLQPLWAKDNMRKGNRIG